MKDIDPALRKRIDSLITSMGYEFVGIEWRQQDRHVVLRIYIDKPAGVTLDDCTKVSRQVGAMLDVDGSIQGRYVLELSSPGIDRPLFEIGQYRKQIGQRIKLNLRVAIQDRRNWVGVLLRVEEDQIDLLVEGVEIKIPFYNIEKGNVIGNIG